jgi:hypothetical protein
VLASGAHQVRALRAHRQQYPEQLTRNGVVCYFNCPFKILTDPVPGRFTGLGAGRDPSSHLHACVESKIVGRTALKGVRARGRHQPDDWCREKCAPETHQPVDP